MQRIIGAAQFFFVEHHSRYQFPAAPSAAYSRIRPASIGLGLERTKQMSRSTPVSSISFRADELFCTKSRVVLMMSCCSSLEKVHRYLLTERTAACRTRPAAQQFNCRFNCAICTEAGQSADWSPHRPSIRYERHTERSTCSRTPRTSPSIPANAPRNIGKTAACIHDAPRIETLQFLVGGNLSPEGHPKGALRETLCIDRQRLGEHAREIGLAAPLTREPRLDATRSSARTQNDVLFGFVIVSHHPVVYPAAAQIRATVACSTRAGPPPRSDQRNLLAALCMIDDFRHGASGCAAPCASHIVIEPAAQRSVHRCGTACGRIDIQVNLLGPWRAARHHAWRRAVPHVQALVVHLG